MTYFRYAERDVDSQINWAQVGKNMTDMLDEKVRLRQEKKDLLDEASRNYAQQLTDAPMGDSTHINNFTLDAANDMREYHLMLDNLLKSGKMDPREYLKSIQNMQTDTTNLFNLSKEYSAGYAETMERMKNEESQKLEQSLRASLDGYSKLGNHKAYINPTDGSLSIGQMIEGPDGVMQMGKPVTIAELRNRLTEKYNRYDVNGSVAKAVKSIPSKTKIREISNKYGSTIFEEEDFTKFPEFKEWFEDTKNGLTVVDTNLTSILTENVVMASNGQEYSFVQKQGDVFVDVETGEVVKKKEANHIETSINRNSGKREFNFTEEQITAAKDYVGTQIISQLKDEQTFKRAIEPPRPTPEDSKLRGKVKAQDTVYSNIAKLYYGDEAGINEAINNIRGLYPDLVIQREADNITVYNQSTGKTEKIPFKIDGKVIPQEQWVKANANFFLSDKDKIKNIDEVAGRNKIDLNRKFSEAEGFGAPTQEVQEGVVDAFDRVMREEIPIATGTFKAGNEEATRVNVSNIVTKLPGLSGYTVDETGIGNIVVVNDPRGNEVLRFDLDEKFIEKDFIDALYGLSNNITSTEDKALYTQGKRKKGAVPVKIPGPGELD